MTGTPNRTLHELLNGTLDLDTDTLRIALFDDTTAYTFDPDTDEFVSDILDAGTTAQELSGSQGYTGSSDRKTLQNTTLTTDNTNDKAVFDADDVEWLGVESTAAIQGWIIYKQVGADDTTPGDDPVVIVVDDDMADAPTNLPLETDGNNVNIAFDTVGVATLEAL